MWGRGPWMGGPAGAASLRKAWWQWAAVELPWLGCGGHRRKEFGGHHLGLTLSVEMAVLPSYP